MRRSRLLRGIITVALLVAPPLRAVDFDELKRQFDYDASQPLDVKETLVRERDGVKLFDISYASPREGRAMAYLLVPAGAGPHAGVTTMRMRS